MVFTLWIYGTSKFVSSTERQNNLLLLPRKSISTFSQNNLATKLCSAFIQRASVWKPFNLWFSCNINKWDEITFLYSKRTAMVKLDIPLYQLKIIYWSLLQINRDYAANNTCSLQTYLFIITKQSEHFDINGIIHILITFNFTTIWQESKVKKIFTSHLTNIIFSIHSFYT